MILIALLLISLLVWLLVRPTAVSGWSGTVVYDDAGFRPAEPLVSRRFGLRGKPDYIVRRGAEAFPVEYKPRRCGRGRPYDDELAQLYAYCLLVEDWAGSTVRRGVIEFADRTFDVPFDADARHHVLGLIEEIRQARGQANVDRSHGHARRCSKCGFRPVCDQTLIVTSGTPATADNRTR